MNALQNVKQITEYYANCPESFEEKVGANMAYSAEDFGFYIYKSWVNDAEPEFKTHDIHKSLVKFFEEHPDAVGIHLQLS